MYSMRRSPAGWLGLTMILAGVLWLASDLVVSVLVVPIHVVGRCNFNTTGHYGVVEMNETVGPNVPGNIGIKWDLITGARTTSLKNGGLTGIFHKVNFDPTFRADSDDVIGRWGCQRAGNDVTYPSTQSSQEILLDLYNRNLLYNYPGMSDTSYIGTAYTQLLVWTSPFGDWSQNITGTPDEIIKNKELHLWDVRAAVDLSSNNTQPKVMRPFHCTMNAPSVNFILGKIQPQTTLQEFITNLAGLLYGYLTDDIPIATEPDIAIAAVLDQIVMSAGLGHDTRDSRPFVENPTQGCLASRTQIPMPVIVVWLLATGVFIGVLAYWLHINMSFRRLCAQKYSHAVTMAESAPNGLMGWMK